MIMRSEVSVLDGASWLGQLFSNAFCGCVNKKENQLEQLLNLSTKIPSEWHI